MRRINVVDQDWNRAVIIETDGRSIEVGDLDKPGSLEGLPSCRLASGEPVRAQKDGTWKDSSDPPRVFKRI